MQGPSARKLPKAERRDQLLDTALEIVREKGSDALTLSYLAECAGVSKPVAYDHFGTRSGLLIALYKRLDDLQVAALRQALERAPRRLGDVARVVSRAYVDCASAAGAEWHAVAAALQGDEAMEAFQRELTDSYVALYCQAFAPYTDLPPDELRLRCLGILGAAEAISRAMIRREVAEDTAVASLASMMTAALSGARSTGKE